MAVSMKGFRATPPRLLLDGALYLVLVGCVLAALLLPNAASAWAGLTAVSHPGAAFVGALWLLYLAGHWGVVGGIGLLERWSPAWVARHRTQPSRRDGHPADFWRVVGLNQLVAMPAILALSYGALSVRGWTLSAPLPSAGRLLLELAGLGLLTEVGFWTTHRLLHTPALFRRIHRIHHHYRAPSAITAPYMHVLEFAVGNLGPVLLAAILLTPHFLSAALFTLLAALNIALTHTGMHLPGLPWATHHDWHHHRIRGCYGTLYLLDFLTGDDRELRAQLAPPPAPPLP